MGKKTYEIINNVVSVLDTYSYDPLPVNERTGSMWFKPNQEVVFKRQMPKGKVYVEDLSHSDVVGEKSMGNQFKNTKTLVLNLVVFSTKGDTDPTTGKKDRDLVDYILADVEDKLKLHTLSNASLINFGTYDGPDYDKANNIFYGVLPVVYKYVE